MAPHSRIVALLACLGLLLAGCGGTEGEDAVAEADGEDSVKRLVIGETAGVSYTRLPSTVTADRLAERDDWEIDTVRFSSEDLQVDAVASGVVHIARLQELDAYLAANLGDVMVLAADRPNEFVMIGRGDIQDCSELEGGRIAYHGEGASYTPISEYWMENTCGVDIGSLERLMIAGGENRIVAMMQGEVDATNVQLADWIALDELAPGEFQILASFGDQVDGVIGGLIVANGSWLEENSDIAAEYMVELFTDNRNANADPDYLRAASEQYQSEEDQAAHDTVRQVYLEDLGGFPEDGVIDAAMIGRSLEFFEELGLLESGLEADDLVDFTVLEDVRRTLGVE